MDLNLEISIFFKLQVEYYKFNLFTDLNLKYRKSAGESEILEVPT